ncbi:hypothetical protein GQ600_13828 [Phytophthora cactorum]|nr:hypothetical protein GQ600_13828 [Phytophthora cactorum]
MRAMTTMAKCLVPIRSAQVCIAFGDWSCQDGLRETLALLTNDKLKNLILFMIKPTPFMKHHTNFYIKRMMVTTAERMEATCRYSDAGVLQKC